MKTWEELNSTLRCLPVMAVITRIIRGKHSIADLQLLGHAITGDYQGRYRLFVDRNKKRITVNHGYNAEKDTLYTVSVFHMPDAFLGVES